MYLRLGTDLVVNSEDIIGIFDFDNCTTGKRTLPLLSRAQKENLVEALDPYDLPRSFLILSHNGKERLILSPTTAATLRRRLTEDDHGF